MRSAARCTTIALLFLQVGCDRSFLHDVQNREPPTDIGRCAPNGEPSDLRAVVTPAAVTLHWQDNSANEDGFTVLRTTGGVEGTLVQLGTNATSYPDAGVDPDTEYQYRVFAYLIDANNTECETGKTPALVVHSAPYAPEGLAAAAPTQPQQVVLEWLDKNRLGTGYVVQRFDETAGVFTEIGTVDPPVSPPLTTGTTTSFEDAGLLAGAEYEYRVYATNKDGASKPVGAIARTAILPDVSWTFDPILDETCRLTIPGESVFDTALGAAFAGGVGTIDRGVATVAAGPDGISGVITNLTPGPFDTTWTVTDTLGGTSVPLARSLELRVGGVMTRSGGRLPTLRLGDDAGPGRQALLPSCSTCTGIRGAVATAGAHTCVLSANGTVECWGENSDGQLGNGLRGEQVNPVRPCSGDPVDPCQTPLADIGAVAAFDRICVTTIDGRVLCWGTNSLGRLGINEDLNATNKVQYATPACVAGGYSTGDCVPFVGAAVGEHALAMVDGHTCAVTTGGNLYCWGDNYDGQLGTGNTDRQNGPALVCETGTWDRLTGTCAGGAPLSDVVAVALGEDHTCVITEAGAVRTARCWGRNDRGQVGNGEFGADVLWPQDVCDTGTVSTVCTPLTGVVELAAGTTHTCALLDTGEMRCWGRNEYGQMGIGIDDNTSTYYLNPVPVCAAGVWDGSICNSLTVHQPLQNIATIAAYETATCAVLTTGEALCWGYNYQGALGDGTNKMRILPTPVCRFGNTDDGDCEPLVGAVEIHAGNDMTCAEVVTSDLLCWGDNGYAQLGIGVSGGDRFNATPVCANGTGSSCTRLTRPGGVAIGENLACAADDIGGLLGHGIRCWGYDVSGQLGRGPVESSLHPTPVCISGAKETCVPLDRVVSIGAGMVHTCALRDDGSVWCWGGNNSGPSTWAFTGQLGLGDYRENRANATPVCETGDWDGSRCTGSPLAGVAALAVGGFTTCVILDSGEPRCWGFNTCGQVGNGEYGACDDYKDPFPVVVNPQPVCVDGTVQPLCVPLTNVVQMDANVWHTCAVTDVGEAYCWGFSLYGQAGNGTANKVEPNPVRVCESGLGGSCPPLRDVVAVSVGRTETCAILANSEMRCWGNNWDGQLGTGTTIEHWLPTRVCARGSGSACPPLTNVISSDSGDNYTCALLGDGTARCWGSSHSGETGSGADSVNVMTATPVCEPNNGADCTTTPICTGVLQDIVAVVTGLEHACALLADGSMRCWGNNGSNRLGNSMISGSACRSVTVCSDGEGIGCENGEPYGEAAVRSCDVLEVVAP